MKVAYGVAIGLLVVLVALTIGVLVLAVKRPKPYRHYFQRREEAKEWPRQIFLTYKSRDAVPAKIWKDLETYASDFTLRFYDDEGCVKLLKDHFPPKVEETYKALKKGCHKADLWRYCVLWLYGGVYLDIKTYLVKPVMDMFPDASKCYTVRSAADKNACYQGILAAKAKSGILYDAIHKILNTSPRKINRQYHLITKQLYDCLHPDGKLVEDWVLFQEVCGECGKGERADQYGKCCHIFDGKGLVCHTRHADFGRDW